MDSQTTQPLSGRATSSGNTDVTLPGLPDASHQTASELRSGKRVLIGLVATLAVFALLVVGIRTVLNRRSGNEGAAQIRKTLVYPGARTVVDVVDQGGSVLQLETNDSIDKVQAWYQANFGPSKTLRVTGNSVILKRDYVTATLVFEDGKTSIVIKQAVP